MNFAELQIVSSALLGLKVQGEAKSPMQISTVHLTRKGGDISKVIALHSELALHAEVQCIYKGV